MKLRNLKSLMLIDIISYMIVWILERRYNLHSTFYRISSTRHLQSVEYEKGYNHSLSSTYQTTRQKAQIANGKSTMVSYPRAHITSQFKPPKSSIISPLRNLLFFLTPNHRWRLRPNLLTLHIRSFRSMMSRRMLFARDI